MVKYLVLQLCDTSTSFCHYSNEKTLPNLLPLSLLNETLLWAKKENVSLQILYPNYSISQEYKNLLETYDHIKIISSDCKDEELIKKAHIVVFNNLDSFNKSLIRREAIPILRLKYRDLISKINLIKNKIKSIKRLNLIFTDIENFKDNERVKYENCLYTLSDWILDAYSSGFNTEVNLLTDRLFLNKMNNCNAGHEMLSICPDGKFYPCPSFYLNGNGNYSLGNLGTGLSIKNPQLYKLSYSPICRLCDAYHCKRCIWLNKKLTLEINTPSHEQCYISHMERNISQSLLNKFRDLGEFKSNTEFKEITYLDPIEIITL